MRIKVAASVNCRSSNEAQFASRKKVLIEFVLREWNFWQTLTSAERLKDHSAATATACAQLKGCENFDKEDCEMFPAWRTHSMSILFVHCCYSIISMSIHRTVQLGFAIRDSAIL